MSGDSIYTRNYSVTGLYERLRENAGNYPDTMDQRYGAWAWLLSLFRLVYEGGGHAAMYLPARHGQLFCPDEYPFLEGRTRTSKYEESRQIESPRISDGVLYRVLQGLLVLDGERLSYRSLDVEQIGSVYEATTGFAVEQADGASIGVRPQNVVVNVEKLLTAKPSERAKLLKEWAACDVTGKSLTELKEAKTAENVVAALGRKVSPRTPNLMPPGSLYLQPGEERRRSGTHYTPRALTAPIVRNTLRPVLEALGERPTAAPILALKICDLAMGSGAFLVEACRQLAEQVTEAWNRNGLPADLPEGEEPLLYARRLVAQRCLYGVDKNLFAVNLATLSLWLVTLAKEQPFTFLDHALKCGDSLVGLSRAEIGSFGKKLSAELPLMQLLEEQVDRAKSFRSKIWAADTLTAEDAREKEDQLKQADGELAEARLTGDIAIAAFFEGIGKSKRDREAILEEYSGMVWEWRKGNTSVVDAIIKVSNQLRQIEKPIMPFHWEIEFPEVFDRENSGFDAIVGNPPFAGKNTTSNAHAEGYLDWLKVAYLESHGNSDLVAYFFRRAFNLIRQGGTFGLIATNTIAQGDTRSTGLRWICTHGGTIYNAQKRFKWVGVAAVVVSTIAVLKGRNSGFNILNRKKVPLISAFLFPKGGSENPAVLLANADKSFQGSIVLGMGFTFDDSNPDATSIAEMHRLIEQDPRNAERIFPYLGGEEVNSSPTHAHHRYVINFGEMSEVEAWEYPDLMKILEEKVKPARLAQKREIRARYWWRFGETTPALFKAITPLERVLVTNAQASASLSFIFYDPKVVFANSLNIFPFQNFSSFVILQSRIHEVFARFFSSSIKDDLRYNPSDCFETFPFPENWETNPTLEAVGKDYYEYRTTLMVRNNQGLTDTYNRFHDPNENHPDILKLRQLHAACDRAVVDAYGWTDISTECIFLLDYEEEEEEESGTGRQKKKPWRYRWPEEIHDEVLARLLILNKERAEAERIAGAMADKAKQKGNKKKANKSRQANSPTLPNFPMAEEKI